MGIEKRTMKIIIAVVVAVLIIGSTIGFLFGLHFPYPYIELIVRPTSDDYHYGQPHIEFNWRDQESWYPWYRQINEFLKDYETTVPEDPPRAPCTVHNRIGQHTRSSDCNIAMNLWHPCTVDNFYGYPEGRPCVFLRLDNIHNWVPEPYNITTLLPVPKEMPDNIKQAMINFNMNGPAYLHGDYIWVSCEGVLDADKENIGLIKIIPEMSPPGFPTHRLTTADRLSQLGSIYLHKSPGPLVAVYFENPRRNVVINVECSIWSQDIDRSSRVGRKRFELYILE